MGAEGGAGSIFLNIDENCGWGLKVVKSNFMHVSWELLGLLKLKGAQVHRITPVSTTYFLKRKCCERLDFPTIRKSITSAYIR